MAKFEADSSLVSSIHFIQPLDFSCPTHFTMSFTTDLRGIELSQWSQIGLFEKINPRNGQKAMILRDQMYDSCRCDEEWPRGDSCVIFVSTV